MMKRNLLATLGLSLVGLGLTMASSKALTYSNDDLLLAFYTESDSTSVVFNIGQASTYRDASGERFLSIGSVAADLKAQFGDDWATRGDLHWGVFGTSYNTAVGTDAAWTLYASRVQTTIGSQTQPYNLGSIAAQSQPATRIKDSGDAYAATGTITGLTAGANAAAAVQSASADNDFGGYQTGEGGTSYSYFSNALADFANGVVGSAVDLFRMPTGSSTSKGTYTGTFTVGSDGVVRFSTVSNPSPTPTPTPVVTTPTPAPTPAGLSPAAIKTIKKQIAKVQADIKKAKKIDDAQQRAKKLKALKKKLSQLKNKLK